MAAEDFFGVVGGDRFYCFAIGNERNSGGRPASTNDLPGLLSRPLLEIERQQLQRWLRAATTPQRVARRSRIVLLADAGEDERQIARRLETTPANVRLWCSRVAQHGISVLQKDAPGRGRKRSISDDTASLIIAAAATPKGDGSLPSVRALAKRFSVSAASVYRILQRPPRR